MTSSFSEELYQALFERAVDGSLVDLWLSTHYDERGNDLDGVITFRERRDVFLWMLTRLLREGALRLVKNGCSLDGTVEEQVQAFGSAWPDSAEAADRATLLADDVAAARGRGVGMNLWFYSDDCPGEALWRQPDGSYCG